MFHERRSIIDVPPRLFTIVEYNRDLILNMKTLLHHLRNPRA